MSDAWIRFFRDTNTTGSKQVRFHQGDGSTAPSANIGVGGNSSWFQVDGGNFGIGTTAPQSPFHLYSGSSSGATPWGSSIAALESSGHGYLSILTPDNSERGIFFGGPANNVGGGITYNNPGLPDGMQFRTDGQNRMVIDAGGFVGIGTTTPVFPLHVESANTAIHGDGLTGVYGNSSSSIGNGLLGINSSLTGASNGVQGLTSSTAGRGVYGRANANSGATFGVDGESISPNGRAVYGLNTATSGNAYGVYGVSSAPDGRAMQAIATNSSGFAIGVYASSASASGFDFYAGGAGTNYGATSSRRWKRNLQPIGRPLEKLEQLQGVYFDWDEEHGGQHDVGMIAEEVGAVLPEIVQYEENGVDAIGMDYSKLTPLLVEAVNAQQAEIEDLRLQLEAMQSMLDQLVAHQSSHADIVQAAIKEHTP